MSKLSLPTLALLSVLPLLTPTAHAAQPAAAGSAAKPNAKPTLASREELRFCMDSEDDIKSRRKPFEAARAEHEAELARHQADAMALADEEAKVDATDQQQVDAFNAKVEERNAAVVATNQRSAALRAQIKAFDNDIMAHNRRCSALVYRYEDRAAVLKERQQRTK